MHISSICNRNILANINHDSISAQVTILSLFILFGVPNEGQSRNSLANELIVMSIKLSFANY